jgi:hypothetical protein
MNRQTTEVAHFRKNANTTKLSFTCCCSEYFFSIQVATLIFAKVMLCCRNMINRVEVTTSSHPSLSETVGTPLIGVH